MRPHLSGQYSPLRDKRRQSDAKWRASVATCYDALKYVIPNVKNLSKKKISKALILQECEKHIQDLEDTISFLFHVECKNQGQIVLWKEGHHWTQCSLEKLHADFSEKQRRLFTSSGHGRRCYNLLRDIKEDVFSMTADSKQMTFVREDSLELVRQQPRPRQRLICQAESDIDTALLQGMTDCERNTNADTCASSCESVYLLAAEPCGNDEKHQFVHCVASPETSSSAPEVSSSTHISLAVSDITEETSSTPHSHDGGEIYKLKLENFTDGLYIVSNDREYTCLLSALEAEKEQEVPSLENVIKTTRIKRPRLTNSGSDNDCPVSCTVTCGINSKESSCPTVKENLYTVQNSTGCVSHTSRSKISTRVSRSGSFSSLSCLNVPDIKMEANTSISCSNHDPMLSSLNTPKCDLDMPLFCLTENDGLIKQQPKYRSARKRLNFNCPSFSGWFQNSPNLVSPDKTTHRSSMPRGFTPVKLPDDFSSDQDNPLESLISPWKTLDSPFNTRIVPQGYIDSNSAVDLEDNLLCLENIDTLDFVNGLGTEITPAPTHHSEKSQQPENQHKTKGSSLLTEPDTRVKPKCRRRLERFYDQETPSSDHDGMSDESHVVPQLGSTFWASTSPHCQSHPSIHAMFDLEESLVCLETLDTVELCDDIDN